MHQKWVKGPQHLVINEREYKSLYDWCQLGYHHAGLDSRDASKLVWMSREECLPELSSTQCNAMQFKSKLFSKLKKQKKL